MTFKLEHCQPFATAVASSGENIRSSGEPGKGESVGLVGAEPITVCGIVQRAANMTERWLGRGQSQQRFCTLGQILSKKYRENENYFGPG